MLPKEMQDPAMRRVIFSSLIGATIEWYDFFLYGVVAGIVFNKLFFPNSDPLVSTMLAYTTFAVGFVTRPLGGVISSTARRCAASGEATRSVRANRSAKTRPGCVIG